jgi:predicted GIY-YIG superfamily endonuclease
VLESLKDGSLYKGYTDNLKRRFLEHNQKRGGSCTSKHAPFKINYYESFLEKADAAKSERFFKIGYGREVLRDRLGN